MDEPLSASRGATHRKDCKDHRRDREERARDKERDRRRQGRIGRMAKTQARRLGLTGQGAEADPETRKQAEAALKKLEQEREDALNQKKKAVEEQKKFADDYERVKAELDRIKASQTQEAAPPPPPPPPKNDDGLAAFTKVLEEQQKQIVALAQQQRQQQVSLMPAPRQQQVSLMPAPSSRTTFDVTYAQPPVPNLSVYDNFTAAVDNLATAELMQTQGDMVGVAKASMATIQRLRQVHEKDRNHEFYTHQRARASGRKNMWDVGYDPDHSCGGHDGGHDHGGDPGPGGDPGGGGGFPSGGCPPFGPANNNQGHFTPVVYQIRN